MKNDPTFIGTVQDVNGTTVRVELTTETVTGLSFVNGEGYRIGQVGSFIRIPLGFLDLYGVVSQVGAGAAPQRADGDVSFGNRWILVQIVGEGHTGGHFERGISQHPTIDDRVHIITESDLKIIYGSGDPQDYVSIGHLASAESIPSMIDINKLITRHSAVLGTTGCGKSTTVAGLLHALSDPNRYPSSRIVVLDIHGEYARALSDRASVFKISANAEKGQRELYIPYWALSFTELNEIAFGNISEEKSLSVITDMIVEHKKQSLKQQPRRGVERDFVTVDTPVPFSIHKLWFELHQREYQTVIPQQGEASNEVRPAYVLGEDSQPVQRGDPMLVIPPLYRNVKTTGTASERVQWGPDPIGVRSQLAGLASRLRDPRLSFLFRPGDWLPLIDGSVKTDIDILLEDWIGGPQPISILDLSGIPSTILNNLVGALLRILYDSLFWARNLPEGGRERPLLVVLEEAHAYLGKDARGPAAAAVRRIAKEGRKYGVGMMLVSQRPSEIDPTILSQCGTFFAMRLTNDIDRGHVTGATSDNLKGLFDMLPVLRTGEAIIVGEAVSLPVRTLITPPAPNRRPDSIDPKVAVHGKHDEDGYDGPGSWVQRRDPSDYGALVYQWRKQDPHYEHQRKEKP